MKLFFGLVLFLLIISPVSAVNNVSVSSVVSGRIDGTPYPTVTTVPTTSYYTGGSFVYGGGGGSGGGGGGSPYVTTTTIIPTPTTVTTIGANETQVVFIDMVTPEISPAETTVTVTDTPVPEAESTPGVLNNDWAILAIILGSVFSGAVFFWVILR
jgi:hypothetical protein